MDYHAFTKKCDGMCDSCECPPADQNGEKAALLLEFAKFLHTLQPENGFDVGPARVRFDAHGATEKVLWATHEDTARWVAMFMDRRRA